jgi:predicted kinase
MWRWPNGRSLDGGIYSAAAQQQTYTRLHTLVGLLLRAGWSVIVDATFLKRGERDAFRALAQDLGLAFEILAPQASADQLRQRIQARSVLGHDASEATLAVLERQIRTIEPLGADEQ